MNCTKSRLLYFLITWSVISFEEVCPSDCKFKCGSWNSFCYIEQVLSLDESFSQTCDGKKLKGCFFVFTDSSCQTSLCCCPHKEYYFHSGSVIIISFLSFLLRLNRINKQHQFHTSSFVYFLFMKRVTYKHVLIITS